MSAFRILVGVLLLGLSIGCAHHESRAAAKSEGSVIDKEVGEQPSRNMHGGVARKGFEAIRESKSLTEEEKQGFLDIHARMTKETFAIQDETSRLKGLLFDTITTRPFNSKKVDEIKKKLVELNDKKMKSMFQALADIQKILNRVSDEEMKDLIRPFLVDQPGHGAKL